MASATVSAPEAVIQGDDAGKIPVISGKNGATFSKAGQTFDDGFLQSLVAAYCNVVYNPLYVIIYLVAVVTLMVDKPGQTGILEYFQQQFNTTATDITRPFAKMLAFLLSSILGGLISFKAMFVTSVLWWFPVMLKPSNYNVAFGSIGSLFMYAFPSVPAMVLVLFSQMFFLFTQLRNPKYKFFIVFMITVGVYSTFTTASQAYVDDLKFNLQKKFTFSETESISNLDFVYTATGKRLFFDYATNIDGVRTAITFAIPFEKIEEILDSPNPVLITTYRNYTMQASHPALNPSNYRSKQAGKQQDPAQSSPGAPSPPSDPNRRKRSVYEPLAIQKPV